MLTPTSLNTGEIFFEERLVFANLKKEVEYMSVVIIGGNDCMVRKYIDLCEKYECDAKVFTQMKGNLRNQIGRPDLLVLFTGTMCHKMARVALSEIKGKETMVARSHSSSLSALKNILEVHVSA